MSCLAVLFAGTTEGRLLAERMEKAQIPTIVCVATEYGEQVLQEMPHLTIHTGRLSIKEMEALLRQCQPAVVVDATHVYAVEATQNIQAACAACAVSYLRLLRQPVVMEPSGCTQVYFNSAREMARFLEHQPGNLFFTTGSKDLGIYLEEISDISRIYVRILPVLKNLEVCCRLGLEGRQIICMQGPFSTKLNQAMLSHCNAAWLVTKESGKAGGFPEKCEAAKNLGIPCAILSRPGKQEGNSLEEVWEIILGLYINEN